GREGALVNRGDMLLKLDPRDREVQKLKVEALLRQRRIELQAAKKLGEKGFQAETNVVFAEANFAAAEAALKRAELALDHTVINAPFAGILDRRHVEIGDYVDIGDPVARVLDRDPYLVTGDVTETQVGKLETGMNGQIRLATGDKVEGVLRYIASQADEQTRTFEIELEVPNPNGRLTAGISAEIRLSLERIPAHRVSPSVLTLADDGALGVKTVDDRDVVVFLPVNIAKADQNHVWLTGLPKEVRLITVGQGFVSDGAKVRPVPVDDSGDVGDRGTVVSEADQ
ncbi:MAG: efflux RND transporter periplasmic adaptor subunit, partial [Alphaproteobacteria bacterium]|nr:efflux RND transporter periplasmic adaptor subunit [Alphaproteobacteria bacterium]